MGSKFRQFFAFFISALMLFEMIPGVAYAEVAKALFGTEQEPTQEVVTLDDADSETEATETPEVTVVPLDDSSEAEPEAAPEEPQPAEEQPAEPSMSPEPAQTTPAPEEAPEEAQEEQTDPSTSPITVQPQALDEAEGETKEIVHVKSDFDGLWGTSGAPDTGFCAEGKWNFTTSS